MKCLTKYSLRQIPFLTPKEALSAVCLNQGDDYIVFFAVPDTVSDQNQESFVTQNISIHY